MEKNTPLITASWLAQHLEDPNLVILDTRFSLADPQQGQTEYQQGHIPGAYYLDLNKDLSSSIQAHGGRHPQPDWNTLVTKLNQLGIRSSSADGPTQVVIYDDSRFAFAARLWWMLRYLGHEQVALLDGGIQAWKSAGYALTTDAPTATTAKQTTEQTAEQTGDFHPTPQPDWLVDIETVRQRKDLPEVTVIDSRSPERWRGEVEPIDPVAGSVPGSINSFWKNVSTEDGQLKSADELSKHWAQLKPDDEIIVYCGSGVTACVNLFSLVMAGHPMHKLYPGGWSDWCSYL
ncbi:MAG: sulfurtransferase [Phormidesmis sp.]